MYHQCMGCKNEFKENDIGFELDTFEELTHHQNEEQDTIDLMQLMTTMEAVWCAECGQKVKALLKNNNLWMESEQV